MGVNCKIYLANHASPKKIFEVVNKYLGHEFIKDTFEDLGYGKNKAKPSFNPDEPASKTNPWHMKIVKQEDCKVTPEDLSYYRIVFKDLAENQYSSLILVDLDDDENTMKGEKLLNPSSDIAWCAIGKCLVNFFGGKLIYSDSNDKQYYINRNPKFPKRFKGQTSDERWFQYHNALSEIPMIKKSDLDWFVKKQVSYLSERTNNLMVFLENYEKIVVLHNKLNKDLKQKDDSLIKNSSSNYKV